MDLSIKQWRLLEKPLTEIFEREEKRGRPRQDARAVLNGIIWICRTGAPWADLPGRYPPYQTCHRYFKQWCENGLWDKVLRILADDLRDRGKVDITECFIDGTFASAKKGGLVSEKLREEKAQRSWRSLTLLVFLSPYGPSAPASTK